MELSPVLPTQVPTWKEYLSIPLWKRNYYIYSGNLKFLMHGRGHLENPLEIITQIQCYIHHSPLFPAGAGGLFPPSHLGKPQTCFDSLLRVVTDSHIPYLGIQKQHHEQIKATSNVSLLRHIIQKFTCIPVLLQHCLQQLGYGNNSSVHRQMNG